MKITMLLNSVFEHEKLGMKILTPQKELSL